MYNFICRSQITKITFEGKMFIVHIIVNEVRSATTYTICLFLSLYTGCSRKIKPPCWFFQYSATVRTFQFIFKDVAGIIKHIV